MNSKSKVINLGCRLNSYESSVITEILNENNIHNTTVINTCAVTNQAVQRSKKAIKLAKKNNPNNKIIVTGCASEIDPKMFNDMNEVNEIIENKYKTSETRFMKGLSFLETDIKDQVSLFPKKIGKDSNKSRALLQIQQGCDHRCTFCIIPFGRGDSISLPLGEIVNRTDEILDSGYKEITITGIDITSYGNDLPGKPKLGEILQRLLKIKPKLERLRLSSIDPAEVDDDLLDLILYEPRFLPHVHLSIQSGDDLILKRMKRRHSRSTIFKLFNKIKKCRPEITFGADFIVGFPTEGEENFRSTYSCIEQFKFSNLHIFPYSPKLNTPASRMPQVNEKEKNERSKLLRKLGENIKKKEMLKEIGNFKKILFENKKLSYTDDYYKATFSNLNDLHEKKLRGKVIKVQVSGVKDNIFQVSYNKNGI